MPASFAVRCSRAGQSACILKQTRFDFLRGTALYHGRYRRFVRKGRSEQLPSERVDPVCLSINRFAVDATRLAFRFFSGSGFRRCRGGLPQGHDANQPRTILEELESNLFVSIRECMPQKRSLLIWHAISLTLPTRRAASFHHNEHLIASSA